ncbi:hypothetical protein CHLRE_16g649750v5 [Chlamydomonas reinhardtii]|uniref:Uncharacterized protein n=1 Tax=Chlamydomonas reinhardtii TaxID=3055 RepID=A0A2K3CSS7_CHLRE|nr:uncharacterized protein CHLRE_16g649750v5 [Chlamydomonas reinhardtii]PNW71330.1 hypothetical protein CHLRE_16g649750v5 [Chlamydomonas reinhardtii]
MAAAKCSATGQASSSASRGDIVSLAAAVEKLNALSSVVSLEPSEYSWGTPSIMQQQALYSQFMQLCVMSSLLPQLSYASAMSMPTARPAMFPGFMTPFPGFAASPVTPVPSPPAPSSIVQPSQAPCAEQPAKATARPEGKASKASGSPKKAGSKSKAAAKSSTAASPSAQQQAIAAMKAEDMDLDALLGVLGDDSFLENLQDDVLSEGSNGSSSTMDGRLQKATSNGSFHNDFASAFDLDMDDLPAAAASPDGNNAAAAAAPHAAAAVAAAAAASTAPAKSHSGDLNNLMSGSPTKSTRSSRREAAAAQRSVEAGNSSTGMMPPSGAAAAASAPAMKISLKVKGGVSKASVGGAGPKAARVAAAAAHVAAAAPSTPQQQAGGEECPLSGAELSRLLGEDDNRIPDGWDLDLDFENPFSCSITAF